MVRQTITPVESTAKDSLIDLIGFKCNRNTDRKYDFRIF